MTPPCFQAIVTKYYGPGNVRGSRVKATAAAGSVTLYWDDKLGADANHIEAAKAFVKKLGWPGAYYMGGMKDGSRVFVCAPADNPPAFEVTP